MKEVGGEGRSTIRGRRWWWWWRNPRRGTSLTLFAFLFGATGSIFSGGQLINKETSRALLIFSDFLAPIRNPPRTAGTSRLAVNWLDNPAGDPARI